MQGALLDKPCITRGNPYKVPQFITTQGKNLQFFKGPRIIAPNQHLGDTIGPQIT